MEQPVATNCAWEQFLDERQRKELHLAQVYARDFAHGTTGHNQLMLIDKLAEILNRAELSGADLTFPPKS